MRSWHAAMRDMGVSSSVLLAAGCGMCAVPFNGLYKDDLDQPKLVKIQQMIKQRIPVGMLTLIT